MYLILHMTHYVFILHNTRYLLRERGLVTNNLLYHLNLEANLLNAETRKLNEPNLTRHNRLRRQRVHTGTENIDFQFQLTLASQWCYVAMGTTLLSYRWLMSFVLMTLLLCLWWMSTSN